MASLLSPPTPPKSTLSAEEQIKTFTQMLKSLEESAKYQEEAIAYHTESLKVLKEESENTKSQLDLCRNTIEILSKTQKSSSAASSTASKNRSKAVIAVEEKTEKSSSKKKAAQAGAKKKQNSKQEKKTKVKSGKAKTRSTFPPSSVLDKYKNITEMVLDFVKKKKGAVVDVSQIIEYAYPKGLSGANRKKASSSFSKVLSLSIKKGIVERTVPGKYRWIGK